MKLTMFEYGLANDMRLCLTREQAIDLVNEIHSDLASDDKNKWDDINDVPKTHRVYDSTGSIWRHDTYDWTFFDDDIGLWVTVPLEQVNSNGPFSLEPQHPRSGRASMTYHAISLSKIVRALSGDSVVIRAHGHIGTQRIQSGSK